MMRNLLLAGLGGGIGSMARYACSRIFMTSQEQSFPWGTLVVNLAGSLLIGLVWGFGIREMIPGNWRLFLMTGLLGGFTTFSAFSLENLMLIQQNRTGVFLLYALGSVIVCLFATWLGYRLSGN